MEIITTSLGIIFLVCAGFLFNKRNQNYIYITIIGGILTLFGLFFIKNRENPPNITSQITSTPMSTTKSNILFWKNENDMTISNYSMITILNSSSDIKTFTMEPINYIFNNNVNDDYIEITLFRNITNQNNKLYQKTFYQNSGNRTIDTETINITNLIDTKSIILYTSFKYPTTRIYPTNTIKGTYTI